MTVYYCNGAGTWADAQTGADHTGNELQGPAGVQDYYDNFAAAGDQLWINGDVDLGRLVTLTVNDTTSWAVGDDLQNNNLGGGSPGDDWSSAVIYEVTDGTHIIMEMQPGETIDDVDISDGVDNTTQTDQETCSAKSAIGIQVNTTAGDFTDGRVKLIGVNGSWARDDSRVTFDGGSGATKSTNCFNMGVTHQHFENLNITDAAGDGIEGNSHDYYVMINCHVYLNGGHGWDANGVSYIRAFRCRFYLNTTDGVSTYGRYSFFISCTFDNNTSDGVEGSSASDRCTFVYCIFHNNTDLGLKSFAGSTLLMNCIIDGNTTGVDMYGDDHLVLFNRITNNTTGIQGDSEFVISGFNLFHDNTADETDVTTFWDLFLSTADSNEYDPDADDGYNDQANEDFNLKDARTYTGETEYIDMEIGT